MYMCVTIFFFAQDLRQVSKSLYYEAYIYMEILYKDIDKIIVKAKYCIFVIAIVVFVFLYNLCVKKFEK